MNKLISDFKNGLIQEDIYNMAVRALENEIEFKSEESDRRYITSSTLK